MINIRVHRVYEFSLFFRKDSSKYKRVEQKSFDDSKDGRKSENGGKGAEKILE